jgi:plastocyanin
MFAPATITVSKGTSVTFANRDSASHTATADGASFDSGTVAQGASKQITFSTVGRFTYHCAFHPFMHGTIVVQ